MENCCKPKIIFKCCEPTTISEPPKCKFYTDFSGNLGACDHRSDYDSYCRNPNAIEEAKETYNG